MKCRSGHRTHSRPLGSQTASTCRPLWNVSTSQRPSPRSTETPRRRCPASRNTSSGFTHSQSGARWAVEPKAKTHCECWWGDNGQQHFRRDISGGGHKTKWTLVHLNITDTWRERDREIVPYYRCYVLDNRTLLQWFHTGKPTVHRPHLHIRRPSPRLTPPEPRSASINQPTSC